MDLKKLVNKGIDSLSPYEPGKPIEDILGVPMIIANPDFSTWASY